jgi:hypothetical protein
MFKKGQTKKGGRKAGTPNKANQQIKESFKLLIENNLNTLQNDLDSLAPKDRLRMIIDLSAYVIPKLKSIDAVVEAEQQMNILNLGEGTPIDLEEIRAIVKDINEDY